MSEEEIQRQADHEALVHALEKRFGLGEGSQAVNDKNNKEMKEHESNPHYHLTRTNPVQAACDRAGMWY